MVTGLTPDNQQFLIQVVATGVFKTQEEALNQAVEALREKTVRKPTLIGGTEKMSPEEWIEDLRQWSESHPRVTHFVDDSRESIY